MNADAIDVGTAFATAFAAKDHDAIARVLADDVDFRALTPNMAWQTHSAKEFIAGVFCEWFGDGDHIEELRSVEVHPVAGARSRMSYAVIVRNADGSHLVEQQAYFECGDGKITWLRVLCAGYIPV